MPIEMEPVGRFATALKTELEKRNLNLNQAGELFDMSYEHMRKIMGMKAFPSKPLVRVMTSKLHVPFNEWTMLLEQDKAEKKFPQLSAAMGVTEELKPFASVVPRLSQKSRNMLLGMAKTLLKEESTK
jgi:hypothetical protein